MNIPILKQGRYLIVSVQAALSDKDMLDLRDNLVAKINEYRSVGVIIDVMALDVIDSFAARTLRSISSMAKLSGAETVIVGIRPDVAFSMVQLGLSLEGVHTALDLDEGLEELSYLSKKRSK